MSFAAGLTVQFRTRSWLFTPATKPDRFANARKNGADVLIVDLEDAVAPELKQDARKNVRTLLDSPEDTRLPPVAVRINTTTSRNGLEDLLMVFDAANAPCFILLPKIEAPQQVLHVTELLKGASKPALLVPMIESAKGLAAVDAIAQAGARIAGLMFGAADFASDVAAQPDALALQLARCRIAAACAQAGVLAIDAPCFALRDPERLKVDLDFATANGFAAKAAIHPSHLEAINAALTPSPERVEWARRVIAAGEKGVGIVDGRMVDEAIAREARKVLAAS
jgi:(S)-citramalyl-CoA lyase